MVAIRNIPVKVRRREKIYSAHFGTLQLLSNVSRDIQQHRLRREMTDLILYIGILLTSPKEPVAWRSEVVNDWYLNLDTDETFILMATTLI
jgi:hypothetical protein